MSVIEANSTLTNFHSPKNIYSFKDFIINGSKTFNASKTSINKTVKKILYSKMSNENDNKNKKKYYNKKKENIKIKKLINKTNDDFKKKEIYKELEEQIDIINKIIEINFLVILSINKIKKNSKIF